MRKLLVILAATAAALIPGAALAAPAGLPDATLTNVQINAPMQFHGIGNDVTVGSNASDMHQVNCHSGTWFGSPVELCGWANASGLCLDTDSSGINIAAACDGDSVQTWLTCSTSGSTCGSPSPYWILNLHWSGVAHGNQFDTANFNGIGSTISANVGPGHGDFATWRCC